MRDRRDVGEILADTELIEAALTRAEREALVRHLQAGQPVAEWRDGRTVWLGPEEIRESIKAIDRELEQFETARRRAAGKGPPGPPSAEG